MPAGFFISIEGIDGAGKSTQVDALCAALRAEGRDAVAVRPHDTQLGELVRGFVLRHGAPIDPWAEALLFFAGRVALLREVILPQLERGSVVVADRFTDSTLAYQGGGRGLPIEELLRLHEITCGGVWPDLTIYLDVPLAVALSRQRDQQLPLDRIEVAPEAFHAAVRDAYEQLAERFSRRIVRVGATGSALSVARAVFEVVHRRFDYVGSSTTTSSAATTRSTRLPGR
jgi:dTMP kinase